MKQIVVALVIPLTFSLLAPAQCAAQDDVHSWVVKKVWLGGSKPEEIAVPNLTEKEARKKADELNDKNDPTTTGYYYQPEEQSKVDESKLVQDLAKALRKPSRPGGKPIKDFTPPPPVDVRPGLEKPYNPPDKDKDPTDALRRALEGGGQRGKQKLEKAELTEGKRIVAWKLDLRRRKDALRARIKEHNENPPDRTDQSAVSIYNEEARRTNREKEAINAETDRCTADWHRFLSRLGVSPTDKAATHEIFNMLKEELEKD
jgi:hypothetical protein